ncbi:1402_t:CDS:2 [Paraglomus occultum]|uniref:1402_t:CDS:1 n=1 Tax=Paraglomus occultum TaxID=144539 RepID=A0A9N9CW35_9GLOM|nr:1402_t:CDS:2 [Paraglomus occultum]
MQDVVKISLPIDKLDLNEVDPRVREAIHEKYVAERIGNDIYIKYDGMHKQRIHVKLIVSATIHNQDWTALMNTICVVGRDEFRPDVGIWLQRPTFGQQAEPIVNKCPPPDVFYNNQDRENALSKIAFVQQCVSGIEYVGIAVRKAVNPFRRNPNSETTSTHATPQSLRPNRAPYLIYWEADNSMIYYEIDWNKYIVLRCGWKLEFNLILDVLST